MATMASILPLRREVENPDPIAWVRVARDFLLLAMNQLINVAAKSRYMYGGMASVSPVDVVAAATGNTGTSSTPSAGTRPCAARWASCTSAAGTGCRSLPRPRRG